MGFLQRLDLTYLNDIYFFQVAKKKATQIKKAPPPPEVKELSIEDDIDEVVVKNWLDNNFHTNHFWQLNYFELILQAPLAKTIAKKSKAVNNKTAEAKQLSEADEKSYGMFW